MISNFYCHINSLSIFLKIEIIKKRTLFELLVYNIQIINFFMKRNRRKLKLLNFFNKRNNKNTKRSSGRKRRIFASAVLAGNLLFGNLKSNDLKTNTTPLSHEKVISNQELKSLDGCQNSGKIIQTGKQVFEFKQEVSDTSSNDMDEIILVKDDGILPGADGFPLNNNSRKPHRIPRIRGKGINVDPPRTIQGLGNIPEAPKVRSFKEVDTGLNARHGNRGDQCPASQFNMEKEYKMFMEDMSQKGIEVECDQQRFNDLSVNQETGAIDEKSIFEAKGSLQGEGQKMYKNLSRPANPDVRLDFEATDIKTGKRIFVDHKGMIDFQSLADQGKDISRFPSHETVAYRMGQDIPSQKERFIGLPQGPKSANEVLHLVNFDKIRNSLEKPSLVSAVLNGAEDAGCGDNIAFINFE
jgi:hypothetical protein